ncbi:carboxypeptidase-like regulatory domain-containing protein [Polaribacter sp. P097]|uniref:carboxypeptidase-like regulatory domain-containing protein n=1 Tax=Polaribacter sp. P097 TaxID=3117398 RepID=UPI002FDFCF88
MKAKLTILLFVCSLLSLAQTPKDAELKTISGFIYHKNKPLKNVTILVDKTIRYTVSDENGFYSIEVKPNEYLTYNYVGLNEVKVLIEDITQTLNIDLKLKSSITSIEHEKVVNLGESTFGENLSNFKAVKIDPKKLNPNATTLTQALAEKIPDILVRYNDYGQEIIYLRGKELDGPAIWEIDEVIFDFPYPIYISEVKDLLIVTSSEFYPQLEITNPLIKVSTSIDYKKIKNLNYNNYYFTKDHFYSGDAKKYKFVESKYPFLDKFNKVSKDDELLSIYKNSYNTDKNLTNYHLAVFNYFKEEKVDKSLLLNVLSDFEKFTDNPEYLKAIAYNYQLINEGLKAIEVYKRILKIRPKKRQSFRDLANAFYEQKQYKNFLKTYAYYLQKGLKIDATDIGAIMSSEIMSVYNMDLESINSTQKIKISNPKKNEESDVRVVIEWNVSEAEFVLELVNPELERYTLKNTSSHNPALIVDQKEKGYQSKELIIRDLNPRNYLLNLTYLGNKQYKPTYFKITTYYNWGRENQSKKIEIFELSEKNKKVRLGKINRRNL